LSCVVRQAVDVEPPDLSVDPKVALLFQSDCAFQGLSLLIPGPVPQSKTIDGEGGASLARGKSRRRASSITRMVHHQEPERLFRSQHARFVDTPPSGAVLTPPAQILTPQVRELCRGLVADAGPTLFAGMAPPWRATAQLRENGSSRVGLPALRSLTSPFSGSLANAVGPGGSAVRGNKTHEHQTGATDALKAPPAFRDAGDSWQTGDHPGWRYAIFAGFRADCAPPLARASAVTIKQISDFSYDDH